MSKTKKDIRSQFRNTVFKRDKYKCVCCDYQSNSDKAIEELDCHHIVDRTLFKNGGYVSANGITLCKKCHWKAERWHATGIFHPGYSPDELYAKIKSSLDEAILADEKNNG